MRLRFLVAALVLCAAGCKRENAYVAPPPPDVGVAPPVRQSVTPYLEATGNTAAYNQVDLVARVQGFLSEIRVADGAQVKRGDTLFVIEPAPYQAKLQQAQAAVDQAQAQATQTATEFNRQNSLGRNDFASQSAVDQARANRDAAAANLLSQQAGLTLAATNLGYTQVTAPFDGVMTAHEVSAGTLVGYSSPTKLASLVQMDPVYVTFTISEQDVLRVREMMRARGMAPADIKKVPVELGLMTEDGYPHRGTLDYAAPEVDPSSGTLAVRGVLDNADHALLPGYFARVRVPMEPAEQLLVPDIALGADQGGPYVLVVDKDNVVQQRAVKTGQLVGTLRVILSGITKDDQVIVNGLQRAFAGEKVTPTPAKPAS